MRPRMFGLGVALAAGAGATVAAGVALAAVFTAAGFLWECVVGETEAAGDGALLEGDGASGELPDTSVFLRARCFAGEAVASVAEPGVTAGDSAAAVAPFSL